MGGARLGVGFTPGERAAGGAAGRGRVKALKPKDPADWMEHCADCGARIPWADAEPVCPTCARLRGEALSASVLDGLPWAGGDPVFEAAWQGGGPIASGRVLRLPAPPLEPGNPFADWTDPHGGEDIR